MAKIPSTSTPKARTVYSSVAGGMYPARITRFVGLGIQDQPEFKDPKTGAIQKKAPAVKVALTFELYDPMTLQPLDVTGTTPEGETVTRPSCVFQDYFLFPGGTRGNVFNMCAALQPGTERVPDDFNWFISRLGAPVQVTIATYPKRDGTTGAKVTAVNGIAPFMAQQMAPARTDLVGFDPYEAEGMDLAYSKMYPFQRQILSEAHDAQHIPLAGTEAKKFDEEAPAQAPAAQMYAQPQANPYAAQTATQTPNEMAFDDDVPFAPLGLQHPALMLCI